MKRAIRILFGISAVVMACGAMAQQSTNRELFTAFEADAHERERMNVRTEWVSERPAVYKGVACRLDTLVSNQKLMSEFFADGNLPAGAAAGRGLAAQAAACAVMTNGMEGAEKPDMLAYLAGIGLFHAGRVAFLDPPKAYHERAKIYLQYAAANSTNADRAASARKHLEALAKMH